MSLNGHGKGLTFGNVRGKLLTCTCLTLVNVIYEIFYVLLIVSRRVTLKSTRLHCWSLNITSADSDILKKGFHHMQVIFKWRVGWFQPFVPTQKHM